MAEWQKKKLFMPVKVYLGWCWRAINNSVFIKAAAGEPCVGTTCYKQSGCESYQNFLLLLLYVWAARGREKRNQSPSQNSLETPR